MKKDITSKKTLTKNEENALAGFYKTLKELRKRKIVRSQNIFGDIGEFLACKIYKELELISSKNNPGYDAVDNKKKEYQIKYSDSSERLNINLGNPDKYDFAVVILRKGSKHWVGSEGKYEFFKIPKELVQKYCKTKKGKYTITKVKLEKILKKRKNIVIVM